MFLCNYQKQLFGCGHFNFSEVVVICIEYPAKFLYDQQSNSLAV